MLIDWFTVAAQALNFLVLMWLLKRFLYRPILDAIAAREKRIADQLASANAKELEAQKALANFRQKSDAFDTQKAELLDMTRKEAKDIHRQLLKEARADADSVRLKSAEALRNEEHTLRDDFIRRTREEVFAITAKVLRDLADTGLEEHMGAVFITHLHNLTDEQKLILASASRLPQGMIVASAFALPVTLQETIKTAIKTIPGADTGNLRFEIVPHLISGIELSVNGHKLAWSIEDYLMTLEKSVGDCIADNAAAEPEQVHAA